METFIRYPLATEKAIRMIEAENTMTFEVERKAKKADIKKQVQELYKVKVEKVNT
ncbi:MAG: 50S ribosomal protein L23, partial [Nanoarchaeota archaeon]